ncbi:MAG: hypothetical protein WAL83_03285 [Arenicellales bacterium]
MRNMILSLAPFHREAKIRERFERSLENLVTLIPCLHELMLFDNSVDVDLPKGQAPRIRVLLHVRDGNIITSVGLSEVPEWAKPVFAAFMVR